MSSNVGLRFFGTHTPVRQNQSLVANGLYRQPREILHLPSRCGLPTFKLRHPSLPLSRNTRLSQFDSFTSRCSGRSKYPLSTLASAFSRPSLVGQIQPFSRSTSNLPIQLVKSPIKSLIPCYTYRQLREIASSRRLFWQARDGLANGSKTQKTDALKPASSTHINTSFGSRLPQIPQLHRPNREELLAAANGFWSRLKVKFKWFSIRSVRPFNVDEISAFFSWVLLGHVLWIILGTTTFFSLAIFALNTVFAQETLARWVGNYLTKSSGIKVVFESAIVPKWGAGVISFKNVFVSRRPGRGKGRVSKGMAIEEAVAAAAAANSAIKSDVDDADAEQEDSNYTQFDLALDTVDVTLSFRKWFNSKGLLDEVEVKGVRGVIDRTKVHYGDEQVDPRSYRREHNPGDFEIESFKMEDLLVTVHQPGGFRPFSVSIYNCELPQLRRQWLFYDFLSASVMSGSFDGSLFTIHPAQARGHTRDHVKGLAEANVDGGIWKKQSRLRIDNLDIDHLNRGVEGPFSWIRRGNVDIVADIKFPADVDESITKIMSDFYGRLETAVTSVERFKSEADDAGHDALSSMTSPNPDDQRFLVLDLKLHLNNVRAVVPIFTRDLSYVNNALIRPIVAYINSRKTFIPIGCRVSKYAYEFDGSWTIFDSGLMDDISQETYMAFARSVADDQARLRRFKKVGLWSLQLAAQAFFMGLAGSYA